MRDCERQGEPVRGSARQVVTGSVKKKEREARKGRKRYGKRVRDK